MSAVSVDEELTRLLSLAVRKSGTDVYFGGGAPPQTDAGKGLLEIEGVSASEGDQLIAYLLAERLSEDERGLLHGQGSVTVVLAIARILVRLHFFSTAGAIAATARLLMLTPPEVDQTLASPAPALFSRFGMAGGLVVVSGPLSSGKTTFGAAITQYRARRGSAVWTIESPPEYTYDLFERGLIYRIAIGPRRDFATFGDAIRSSLRAGVKTVFIGEIALDDDGDSVEAAVEAVDAGLFVILTVQGASTASALARMTEALPSSQRGRFGLTLSEHFLGGANMRILPGIRTPRLVASEIVIGTPSILAQLRSLNFDIAGAIATSRESGMRSLDDDLVDLSRREEIAPEDVNRFRAP